LPASCLIFCSVSKATTYFYAAVHIKKLPIPLGKKFTRITVGIEIGGYLHRQQDTAYPQQANGFGYCRLADRHALA
jgi:hypothetical protein